jgi:hypothetical protein
MKTILACVVTALIVVTATATAASLITGSQIADNTIHNHNIHKNTISLNRLTPGVQKLIKKATAQGGTTTVVGQPGPKGDTGATGANGTNGADGAKGDKGDPGTPANQPGDVVYDAVPTTLPPNMPSNAYQAQQASEFGDVVNLTGTSRHLNTVTVTMSDWAKHSDPDNTKYPTGGWSQPITLNVYAAPDAGHPSVPGALLGGVTQTVSIPWRPEDDASCPAGKWKASDGNCYSGMAFNVTFNLSSLGITLPNKVLIDVAMNTETWGPQPFGKPGPYDSLNIGAVGTVSAGSDDNADELFWNTETAGNYSDGGTGGTGFLRRNAGQSPYGTIPMEITATS